MKTISIITTYPKDGSQNIGDALITQCTKEIIKDTYPNEDICFHVLWRASQWNEIKNKIEESDFIIFACLAIRPNMTITEYPSLKSIISSNISYGVLAAGTSIEYKYKENILEQFSEDTISTLKRINKEAIFFNTRGVLSQLVCSKMGLHRVEFAGDIAFYDKRYSQKAFIPLNQVRRIAISDPHYPNWFLPSLEYLFSQLKDLFPNSEIHILQHGRNFIVEEFCKKHSINFTPIFKDLKQGLEEYNNFDLHVGFRVHAHVSMLKRRKPSYLLEQDGRGIDYGLTLDKKLSINCSPYYNNIVGLKNLIRRYLKRHIIDLPTINRSNIDFLLSIIRQDLKTDFSKFIGLEKQIESFNENNLQDIKKIF